jgi:cell division protein FtsZ
LRGVQFITANTDAQALIDSKADIKIQLGAAMTEGLGAGSRPEIGAAAAEESIEEIRSHLTGLHMVFITAGMGGGTGTGAAPVIAAAARAEGVLTVGVVTKPFHFEGQRRMRSAEFGIELLAEQVDTLIVIPNQNLFKIAVDRTTFSEAFAMADQVLHDGISCITDVMVKEGIINLDFADVNLIMRGMGKAMMGTGEASGDNRGREAAEAAISNPLLDDVTLQGAKGLLVTIVGGRDDLTLYEVDEAANRVREEIAPDANIIVGTAYDETINGTIRVSVVATGLGRRLERKVRELNPSNEEQSAANDQSLAQRLGEITSANAARQDLSGQGPDNRLAGSGERDCGGIRIEEKAPSLHSSKGVEAVPEPNQIRRQPELSASEHMGVRMPELEDFPPVGQAVLRAHSGDVEPAGREPVRRTESLFEKLTRFAMGRRARISRGQYVAEEQHAARQSARSFTSPEASVMDPHVKGGALSNSSRRQEMQLEIGEEMTEFPQFLRKGS